MANASPATENVTDNTKMDFERFKVRLAELLTTDIILSLATLFMFPPAKIDKLRHTKNNPGQLMVSLMEERGQIKPNDISPLLTALEKMGLQGLLSTLHRIFPESEDKTSLFVRYLKTFYKQLYSKINPIPYIREKVFRVNDIFVEGGIEMHGRDIKDTERLLEGNTMEAVKLNSYSDVFNDDIISSKRILLEGDPGYGKSTFTLQAAYDWCNASDSSPLKDVDIFILLPLRLLGGILSICLAVKLILMPPESKLTKEDITEILSNSSGAVLVFDGYDEYPDKDIIDQSEIMKIIAGNMFANFKVITCTRSAYLPDNLDVETVNVRLTGFDDNARDEYIRRAVAANDNQAARRINDLLTSNPLLSDICQVPLFCVMFVHISYGSESILSFTSVTSFFRHILTCFYEHMRNKREHARKPNDPAIIPDYPKLNKLLFDALTGKNQQIVWQKDMFKTNVGNECYNELITIGILIEEDILNINDTPGLAAVSVIQRTTVVRFYHKLFAEWYAANYLSKCAGSIFPLSLRNKFEKTNPVDLQFVFRFACGLNKKASSRIIKYLKGMDHGQSFAILCFFEQVCEPDDVVAMVTYLCKGGVTISYTDSRLLQRSTIQILDIAVKSNIPITSVCLNKSFKECEKDVIVLHSGLRLTQLLTVEKIHIETEQVNKEPRILTEEDVTMIFRYGLRSGHLKDLSFDNCLLPPSIASESIPAEMKSRDIKVLWRNYGYSLNLESGAWKVDDVDTVKRICTKHVSIRRNDSELLQRCTIQLLENASQHDIPISELLLKWSSCKVDKGGIVLQSGLCLPTLSTLEQLSVVANLAELTEEDVIGLLNYGAQSRRFKEFLFYNCKLPTSISPAMIPETARSRNIKVLWPDTTCQLDLQSGKWKQAEDIQTITELCSNVVCINNESSQESQKSTIELLKKASRHDIPIDCVGLVESFNKVDDDDITLYSGLSLPILTSLERMFIYTEEGREMNKHEVNGILNYVQHSQRFKGLGFLYCLLPPTVASSSLANLKARNVYVFWNRYGDNGSEYLLDLQSGHWLLHEDPDSFFPDGEEDSAASNSDKLVDAGLSQSQKKTCDDSLTGKQPLKNIDLEVRTESIRDVEASSISDSSVPSKSGNVMHSEKRCIDESTAVVNPSLPSHQAMRGEAEGNPAGAEAMTKDSDEVTEETLHDLSGNLSKEWRDVGRKLKLKETDLYNIETDNRYKGQREVVYQMLLLWKQKRGMAATNKALIDALRVAGQQDLHDNFLKFGKFGTISVIWPDKTCQLDLQSGKRRQAEDIQTMTELCSNVVGINNESSQESQKSTIELLKEASRHDVDDVDTVKRICTEQVTIRRDDSEVLQRCTIQLLENASHHDIPISKLVLLWSFSKVDKGDIVLQSGLCLPTLSTLEKLSVNASSTELTEEDVIGLLKYGEQSRRFKELWFYTCKLPTSISPVMIPETARSRNITVLWPDKTCQLDLQSGKWKQAEDIQTIKELCSNAVVINNESSQASQKSTIELLKKACRHDIPIDCVVLGHSFNKVDEDDITLYSGLSLPILTSIQMMNILTEKGREMNKHEVNGILNCIQHSQRFKALSFYYCLLPSIIASSSLANLKARNVHVFWNPYKSNERFYLLDLQSGRWLLCKDPEPFFPMLRIGEELTDADYTKEVEAFRLIYSEAAWQLTHNAS